MGAELGRAIVASLDADALDQLAGLLAPRMAGMIAASPTLTVAHAATAAGVSTRTIRRALTAGLLGGRQVAGRWQTTADDLSVWQAAGGPTATRSAMRSARPPSRRSTAAANGADAILNAGRVDG